MARLATLAAANMIVEDMLILFARAEAPIILGTVFLHPRVRRATLHLR